jgi:hypothetical protein
MKITNRDKVEEKKRFRIGNYREGKGEVKLYKGRK